MIIDILILICGLALVILGAEWLVDGSSSIARRAGLSEFLIGMTIVGIGTSMPELVVSLTGALRGSADIAIGNVVGSNIFNTLMVLGVCAIIHPVPVDKVILKRDFPFTIAGSLFLLLTSGFLALVGANHALVTDEIRAFLTGTLPEGTMELNVGVVSRIVGIALIAIFAGYILYLIFASKDSAAEEEAEEEGTQSVGKSLLMIVFGLALIVAGGQAVVNSAKFIAAAAGMSETLIGLTVIALGTSLPELVTSIVAARKGETGLAVGNVVGSNIFNMMFILGISAMIHPVAVNMASMFDLMILIGISLLAFLFCANDGKIERKEGLVMVAVYAADMAFAILR